jgi:putative addiction module antidote
MIQKVLKVGSSAAVTIPKKSLTQLGINIGDEVVVDTNSDTREMIVKPVTSKTSARQEKIATLTLDFIERYKKDLKNLADK